jgi:DNA-binding NarL/FixJ family response regulator
MQDFDISFEWNELQKNYKEILNLPEKIAKKKKLHLVICIDEFQNCESFKESKLFQKKLRTEWQHHQNVTYCLYGSRQHMMSELFEKQSNPFYKFGDVLYLPKISRRDWISFIRQQFKATKKTITEDMASLIATMVQDHSYYVQQLSYLVWIATSKTVTKEIIRAAVEDLLAQNAILYTRDTENLTNAQYNFLKALAEGVHTGLSSKEVMNKYQLGTSANVLKIKKALIQKELIDDQTGIYFLDPAYELWFKKNMLHQKTEI